MKYETPKKVKRLLKKVQKAQSLPKYRTRFVAKIPIFAQTTKNEQKSGTRIEERFLKKCKNIKNLAKIPKFPGITP